MLGPSIFENSTITNVYNAIVLVGALTNRVPPSYTIRSNSISASASGVMFSPVRNLTVTGNRFYGCNIGVGSDDYAYQGTDYNQDIVVSSNTFTQVGYVINIASSGRDRVANLTVAGNTAWGCPRFGNGYGWCTNALFQGNQSLPLNGQQGLLWGGSLWGQCFIDDPSNNFPTNWIYTGPGFLTNTVSYSYGMRQNLGPQAPNTFFQLDDSHPERIPPGATLWIGCFGRPFSATLVLSSTGAAPSLVMNYGDTAACLWTNNSWTLTSPHLPTPPPKLRLAP
jgi:hypothetical protein